MPTETQILDSGVVINPAEMSNEQIVEAIKRLAVVLRDRTAKTIQGIREKKELIDKKKTEIKTKLDKARSEANKGLNDFALVMAQQGKFADIVKIDKSGAIRIPASVMKELTNVVETEETKRLQRMYDALLTASENYRKQLQALGVGTVNIHSDHVYIRLSKADEDKPKEEDIEKIKAEFEAYIRSKQEPQPPAQEGGNEKAEDIAENL